MSLIALRGFTGSPVGCVLVYLVPHRVSLFLFFFGEGNVFFWPVRAVTQTFLFGFD